MGTATAALAAMAIRPATAPCKSGVPGSPEGCATGAAAPAAPERTEADDRLHLAAVTAGLTLSHRSGIVQDNVSRLTD
jgi:hypothetical protein